MKVFSSETTCQILIALQMDVPWFNSYKSSWFVKSVATSWWGIFFVYQSSVNFKKDFASETNFDIISQECYFGDPLPDVLISFWPSGNRTALLFIAIMKL